MKWLLTFLKSSIGRKLVMSLSGLFLITFIMVHLAINLLMFWGEETFNTATHFMATNIVIQLMQYILAAGFIIHIIQGIRLSLINRTARGVNNYAKNNWAEHTPFNARSMIYSGVLVILFLILHLKDFLVPMKLTEVDSDYMLVAERFASPLYVVIYVIAFILLGIHLSHGFKSAFQTVGASNKKYTPLIRGFGTLFSIITTIGFSAIAIAMYIKSL